MGIPGVCKNIESLEQITDFHLAGIKLEDVGNKDEDNKLGDVGKLKVKIIQANADTNEPNTEKEYTRMSGAELKEKLNELNVPEGAQYEVCRVMDALVVQPRGTEGNNPLPSTYQILIMKTGDFKTLENYINSS